MAVTPDSRCPRHPQRNCANSHDTPRRIPAAAIATSVVIVPPFTKPVQRRIRAPGVLTLLQRRAVVALVELGSVKEAAESVGVRRATMIAWRRREPAFEEAIQVATREAQRAVATRVTALGMGAADRLGYLMEHGGKDDRVQYDAAKELMQHSIGMPVRRTEVTGAGGGPIQSDTRRITVVVDASTGRLVRKPPPLLTASVTDALPVL